jgi:hypothetical protein
MRQEGGVPRHPLISIDVMLEFDTRARERLGVDSLSAEDYARLAQRAEEAGHNYGAAVYYHLASLAVRTQRQARVYQILSEEMQDRISLGRAGEE